MTHESKRDCQKRLAELAEAGAFGDLAELEAKLLLIGAAYQNGWQAALASRESGESVDTPLKQVWTLKSYTPQQPSEAAAQPTLPDRYLCCGANFASQHEPHCHNYKTQFEHNDH